ncbi:hypothetical protein [uncultured Corynebacterium sp.]|uniref:hypothetical protein n=1 Tax=uncultured Corynebacterium sp. TaxID=159447 RepID=UPI0025CEB136|nr:hypothetical protein [uncultured Corynebacterium sp.]
MTYPRPALGTSLREQLWSPVQNSTLWLGWWLHGLLSSDDVIDAFAEVQGHAHTLLVDTASGDPFDGDYDGRSTSLVDMLSAVRTVTADAPVSVADRPLVGLVLAGPGDVPALPAGSRGAAAVTASGAGITVADADPDVLHVLVPRLLDRSLVQWTWYRTAGRVPAPVVHSPGDADRLLAEATDRAAALIESDGMLPIRHRAPRLAVGALSDYFGLPGLPAGVSPRAVKLMSRADVVASIVEVTRNSAAGASLDPRILPLSRAVRTARTTAVDHAMRELLR